MAQLLDLAHGNRVDRVGGLEGQRDELVQFLDEGVDVIYLGYNGGLGLDLLRRRIAVADVGLVLAKGGV